MPESLESVNAHSRQIRSWAAAAKTNNDKLHWTTAADALDALIVEVRELRKQAAPLPTRLGDLSDLPEELRSELSGVELDALESQIVTVINSYENTTADLNQILVGLFRKFQVVQKRRPLQQRLWRMQQDDLVWAVQGRKGVYTTKKPPPADDFGSSRPAATVAPALRKRGDLDDEIPF